MSGHRNDPFRGTTSQKDLIGCVDDAQKAEILAFGGIVPAVCPFVVGLAVGSVGDMFSFWTAVVLIFVFAILFLIYESLYR